MNKRNASWLLLAASAMWGSSFVASKYCINSGMLQFEIVFCRFSLGSLLTALVFWKQLRHPTKSAVRTGIAIGLLTALTFTLEMFGLAVTEAAKASFLTATNIVMMPFLYALFFRVRPARRSLLAAVLALAGVGLLSLTGGLGTVAPGDLLLLADAATYGLNSLLLVWLAGDDSRVQISFFQFLTTAVCMGVLTLLQGTGGTYTRPAVLSVLYLAAVPTVLCYLIKNFTLKYLDPVRCTLILSTESIFCAILSALLLKERMSGRMLAGVALICGGVVTEILRPAEAPSEKAAEESQILTEETK
nr:DMT family transporter [uncultured Oscillibacter sp.]